MSDARDAKQDPPLDPQPDLSSQSTDLSPPRWLVPALSLFGLGALALLLWLEFGRPASISRDPSGMPFDESGFRGFHMDPPMAAPAFDLTAQDGSPLALADLSGQPFYLFFGFTHCPDICPNTLAKLGAALESLGPDSEDVKILFVSVDPDRDSPPVIDAYLTAFDQPAMLGATGDLSSLESLASELGVVFFKEFDEGADPEGDDYQVVHSGAVFVVDADGQIHSSLLEPFTPEDLAHDMQRVVEMGRDS